MHIYGYQRTGFNGTLLRVQVAKTSTSFSIRGLSLDKSSRLKRDLRVYYQGPLPQISIQVPPHASLECILAPVLLVLLCVEKNLLEISNHSILLFGAVDLSGTLVSPPPLQRELVKLCTEAGISLILTGENIPSIHKNCISCPSIASALSQLWRFALRHPENEIQIEEAGKKHASEEEPFSGILGLQEAKRALCYAVAGEIPLLFYGPPGSGKSLLLNRTKALLPPLRGERAQEVWAIHGKQSKISPLLRLEAGMSQQKILAGTPPWISRAHGGALLVDELSNQKPKVRTTLAQSLDTYQVGDYPLHCTMVAATNGCRCANLGAPHGVCRCTQTQIDQFWGMLGWPLLDRFAIALALEPEPLLTGTVQAFHVDRKAMEHVRSLQTKRKSEGVAHLFPRYSKVMAHTQRSLRRAKLCCTLAQVISDWEGKESVTQEIMEKAYSLYLLPKDRHYH
nr:ATP-binding protein [uncultured Sphaerochaeta sp.]